MVAHTVVPSPWKTVGTSKTKTCNWQYSVSYFFPGWDKRLVKSDLKKEGLIWSPEEQVYHWVHVARNIAGHTLSTVRKRSHEHWQSACFSLFIQPHPNLMMMSPTFRLSLLASGKPFWKHLHGHSRCVSVVIPNPVVVTVFSWGGVAKKH